MTKRTTEFMNRDHHRVKEGQSQGDEAVALAAEKVSDPLVRVGNRTQADAKKDVPHHAAAAIMA